METATATSTPTPTRAAVSTNYALYIPYYASDVVVDLLYHQ